MIAICAAIAGLLFVGYACFRKDEPMAGVLCFAVASLLLYMMVWEIYCG